jgi:hypothetical protein
MAETYVVVRGQMFYRKIRSECLEMLETKSFYGRFVISLLGSCKVIGEAIENEMFLNKIKLVRVVVLTKEISFTFD